MRVPQAFDSCLHPFRRFNASSKQYSYCACGSCLPCQQKKQKKWEYRLFDHMRSGLFSCLFITLTYDNKHLPLLYAIPAPERYKKDGNPKEAKPFEFYDYKLVTTRFRSGTVEDSDKTERVVSYFRKEDFYNFLEDEIPDFGPNHIIHYVDRRYKDGRYVINRFNCTAVCYKKDVQDFVARLRSHLSTVDDLDGEDLRFTYFIASEYGPETFRPHYHGILFFNSQKVAKYANRIGVFKAWGKQSMPYNTAGDKISSFVNNAQANAAYVSKYVTGYTHLPALLHYKEFRPFHLQSISVPIGSYAIDLDTFKDMLSRGNMYYVSSFKDPLTNEYVTVKRPFADSCIRRLFPKFLCHSALDVPTINKLIRYSLALYGRVPLPDFRKEINSTYSFDKRNLFSRVTVSRPYYKNPQLVSPGYFMPEAQQYITPYYEYLKHGNHKTTYTLSVQRNWTPSVIAPLFLRCCSSDTDDYDRFLFGFDYNRCVVAKLWRLAAEYPWIARCPELYIEIYNQYYSRVSSESFRKISDFAESACPAGKFTADAFAAIYYDSLPPEDYTIYNLPQELYEKFDRVLTSFPDLAVEDFYDLDNGGYLKYSSMEDMPFYADTLQQARYKRNKDKNRKLEKHNTSLNQ